MNIPQQIREFLLKKYGTAQLWDVQSVSGGSINQCISFKCSDFYFFVKINRAARYPAMFEKEAKGLEALSQAAAFTVPLPLLTGEEDGFQFLLMPFIKRVQSDKHFFSSAGRLLALQHKTRGEFFGLDHDNYIGSLPQKNDLHNNGIDFMINCRLWPLFSRSNRNALLSAEEVNLAEKLLPKLHHLLPQEKASLLHGDFWNGNIFNSENGPVLIDPAAYFGFRETDLAMAFLFGGFDSCFYDSYNEFFPLLPGWQARVELFQIYPLLVHLNLFGLAYKAQVMNIVKKYL